MDEAIVLIELGADPEISLDWRGAVEGVELCLGQDLVEDCAGFGRGRHDDDGR